MKKTKNIKFSYRYRDSGNYKNYNSIIFSNPENLNIEKIETAIKKHLITGEYFYHTQFNVPAIFTEYANPYDDPSWHEFESVTETSEKINSEQTVKVFIRLISNK